MNNNKHYFYTTVWSKYVPIIRILIKKSAALPEQELQFNRIDFERAGYSRKTGYRFTISMIKNKPDTIFAGNELIQTFVGVLQGDEVISQILLNNDFTFVFTGKFVLHIKNNTPAAGVDEQPKELQEQS